MINVRCIVIFLRSRGCLSHHPLLVVIHDDSNEVRRPAGRYHIERDGPPVFAQSNAVSDAATGQVELPTLLNFAGAASGKSPHAGEQLLMLNDQTQYGAIERNRSGHAFRSSRR